MENSKVEKKKISRKDVKNSSISEKKQDKQEITGQFQQNSKNTLKNAKNTTIDGEEPKKFIKSFNLKLKVVKNSWKMIGLIKK